MIVSAECSWETGRMIFWLAKNLSTSCCMLFVSTAGTEEKLGFNQDMRSNFDRLANPGVRFIGGRIVRAAGPDLKFSE